MNRIPATVVTGFLGAGKTSLIRHLLKNAGGRRIALVINEFGGREIDCDQAGDGEFGDACPFSGDEVIRALGYDGLSVGLCGAMLITIALAARGGLPLPPIQHHQR